MKSSIRVQLLLVVVAVTLVAAAQSSGPQLDLRTLAALLGSHWRAGQRADRALNPALLLSTSKLIIQPKLEITSPTVPKDGGSFQMYADFPISLGGFGGATFAASDRNDSAPEAASPAPPSAAPAAAPPSPPPAAPPSPPSPPSPPPLPPADAPVRNPTVILSYGRRAGRSEDVGDEHGAPLAAGPGFHDVAQQVLGKLGMDGHSCLLRAVCELAARPLRENGLLGDLINTVAEIPSTSNRTLEAELKVARELGLKGAPCTAVFDNCNNFIIDKLAK